MSWINEPSLLELREEPVRLSRYDEHCMWLMQERVAYIERRGDVCERCLGAGVYTYANTSTWRHTYGGQALTSDVCDKCWGSGVEGKPWPSHRGTVVSAKLTIEEVERLLQDMKEAKALEEVEK